MMRTISIAVALLVSTAFYSECADLTTKDGITYKNAKLVKVEKKTSKSSYFKIVHGEGSKLVNPVDINPFEITLRDGTVLQKIKIMDITKDGISIYDSKSVRTIKFEDMSPESRGMFEYSIGAMTSKEKPQKENTEVSNEEMQQDKGPTPKAAPETKPEKSKNKLMKMNKETE